MAKEVAKNGHLELSDNLTRMAGNIFCRYILLSEAGIGIPLIAFHFSDLDKTGSFASSEKNSATTG